MTRTKRSALRERSFLAGAYEAVTDEEPIEELSFPAYCFSSVNGISRDRQ